LKLVIASTLALLLSTSCEFRRDSRPSILIIAVENLGFDSISCDSEEISAGFDVFCEEAIRFTHAFTPSTMSQAALASVLTGVYPIKHQVRDNGFDYLSANARTVAEAGIDKGYRTALVSGGPPLFRKSGLAQGFELFDDNIEVSAGHYFRPAHEVFAIFSDWLNKEALSVPFFGVLFSADLQFPDTPTFTREGELREKSVEAQLQELGEALQTLIDSLKAKKRWDSTHVILMGLSGGGNPANLKSENTQVALFVKPARLPRDSASHWTIDRNISLVDVGYTLLSLLGEAPDALDNGVLEKVSLQSVLSQPEPNWREDRVIYSESGWTKWRRGQDIRIALRQKQFLWINEDKPLIFNSLVDHREASPLNVKDPLWTTLNYQILKTAEKLALPIDPKESRTRLKPTRSFELAHNIWDNGEFTESLNWELNQTIEHPKVDNDLTGWWARWALEHEDWSNLVRLGKAAHQPLWTFVGESHLNNHKNIPLEGECADIFLGNVSTKLDAVCGDESFQALLRWIREKDEDEKLTYRERFLRIFAIERIRDQVGQLNYLNFAKWDVKLDYPRGPSLTELYLAIPHNHPYAIQIGNLGPVRK
jgi:hypothetical protein